MQKEYKNNLYNTISFHFKISFIFLLLAIFFGLLYSIQLLGYGVDIFPLPILKDSLSDSVGLRYLNLYFYIWYIFLIFMIASLSFGDLRRLPLYFSKL